MNRLRLLEKAGQPRCAYLPHVVHRSIQLSCPFCAQARHNLELDNIAIKARLVKILVIGRQRSFGWIDADALLYFPCNSLPRASSNKGYVREARIDFCVECVEVSKPMKRTGSGEL
jgi:hypothetical protein